MLTATPISFLARGGTTMSVGVGVGVLVDVGAGVGVSIGVEVAAKVGGSNGVTVGRTGVSVAAVGAIDLAGVTAKLSHPAAPTINRLALMTMNKNRRRYDECNGSDFRSLTVIERGDYT
jgi:hypothetical protein